MKFILSQQLFKRSEVRSVVSSLFRSRYLLTNPLKTTAILETFLTNNSINTISNSQTRKTIYNLTKYQL